MAEIRVELFWADDRERKAATDLIAQAQGHVVSQTHGRIVVTAPAGVATLFRQSKLPCRVTDDAAPTLKPFDLPPDFFERVTVQSEATLAREECVRDVFQKSLKVSGKFWNHLQVPLNNLEIQSSAAGRPEAPVATPGPLLDEDSYVVELTGLLESPQRRQLEAIGPLTPYSDSDHVVIRLARAEVALVQKMGFVTTVRRYGLQDTLTPAMTEFFNTTAKDRPTDSAEFDVLLHRPADRAAFEEFLKEQSDVRVIEKSEGSPSYRVKMPAGSSALAALARLPHVRMIAPHVPAVLQMEVAAALVGCREVGPTGAGPRWTGQGEVVAIFDSGIDATHADLQDSLQVEPRQYGQGTAVDKNGHGTHVAGIVAGRGKVVRGVAPGSKLVTYGILDASNRLNYPTDLGDLLKLAVADGAKIINLSWRSRLADDYGIYGRSLDDFVYRNPEVLVVVAAGNEGKSISVGNDPRYLYKSRTIGNPAAAKNVVTVGACRNNRPAYTGTFESADFPAPPVSSCKVAGPPFIPAAFSSRGPTQAQSAKPDLIAPGTMIASTRAAGADREFVEYILPTDPETNAPVSGKAYAYLSGTSMAAPMVSGAAAVLREYLRDVHANAKPSAALLKALLILATIRVPEATADSILNKPEVGVPDYDQGHGRLDLRELLPHAAAPADRAVRCYDIANDSPDALESEVADGSPRMSFRSYPFTVPADAETPLRLALAWTDVPAPRLYNLLALRLRLPDDSSVYGNGTHRLYADPAKLLNDDLVIDEKNNAVCVLIPKPRKGDYLAVVSAISTPQPYQGYALVVCGPVT
ncbi:S8 family serine peptidase [Limnoglobus roseus]|uniref:Peptidase S8 n=1 Tax=Limnoglobus roseus TaxID=2598579 RepID=A0A5C1A5L4_9BACT|nr:S8 family serine peptidase [Limnoglobus roseus]QEL13643.1 peptidase S8 [Limnoglobus roseus]